MKQFLLPTIIGILLTSIMTAQTINLNPDPNGEPWNLGPQPEVTQAMLDSLPQYTMSPEAMSVTAPSSWDNTEETDYFPEIIDQQGYNSCAQAAGIAYTFTYEMNRYRQVSGSLYENQYHHHFTWNYMNEGSNSGSLTYCGWNIVKNNGIPPKPNYILNPNDSVWHTGFNDFLNGTKNRIESYGYMSVDDINELIEFKNYLFNHGDPLSDEGGLGVFYKQGDFLLTPATVGGGSPPYNKIIKEWGSSFLHAMTIVGYDDNVGYDFDNDGDVENVGDLGNWELGCFIVANSWGTGWGNHGFIYVPYRLFASPASPSGTTVWVIEEVEEKDIEMVAKIKLYHDCRNKIKVGVYVSDDPYATAPTTYGQYYQLKSINIYNGGELEILGNGTSDPQELAFDLTDYISQYNTQETPQLRIFLGVDEMDDNGDYEGTIYDFSIIDYRNDPEGFEVYTHEQLPKPIANNTMTNVLIDYIVLPNIINQSLSLHYNCIIVRDNTTIQSPNTFTFNGNYLDFYDNGNLTVNSGASLELLSNLDIYSMRGLGQISINGNLLWYDNISVIDRTPECQFTLFLENPNLSLSMNSTSFRGVIETSECSNLDITNSSFIASVLNYRYGNLNLDNNTFFSSSISISNPLDNTKRVDITNGNVFSLNSTDLAAISIDAYQNFIIDGNLIDNYANGSGIYLTYAGSTTGDKTIRYNTIRNNGGTGDHAGIRAYNSNIVLYQNEINNNSYGLQLYDHSNSFIQGNRSAEYAYETQYIHDNAHNQILSTCGSVPYYCHWNAIVDEDNTDYLFKTINYCKPIDVRWNYWGENFDPLTDLVPGCLYDPIWDLSLNERTIHPDEQMYNTAITYAENGDYVNSKQTFYQLINTYSDSLFAEISIKELYWIEHESNRDFDSLVNYLKNNTIIQNDSALSNAANYIIALCELASKDYQSAIENFEDIIENPPTTDDSLFAIIDLAYTYQQMPDSGNRNYYIGKLTQYKYNSFKDFIDSREYHLSLLLGKSMLNQSPENSKESLLSNGIINLYPNPTSNILNLDIKFDKPEAALLQVFDYLGKEKISIRLSPTKEGSNSLSVDCSNLSNGLYFMVLRSNSTSETRKFIISK